MARMLCTGFSGRRRHIFDSHVCTYAAVEVLGVSFFSWAAPEIGFIEPRATGRKSPVAAKCAISRSRPRLCLSSRLVYCHAVPKPVRSLNATMPLRLAPAKCWRGVIDPAWSSVDDGCQRLPESSRSSRSSRKFTQVTQEIRFARQGLPPRPAGFAAQARSAGRMRKSEINRKTSGLPRSADLTGLTQGPHGIMPN
jgi:hypothetical protein